MNQNSDLFTGNFQRTFLISLFILFIFQSCVQKADKQTVTAQWLGVNRDGIYDETNLLNKWPEAGPEMLWMVEDLGLGYAAPVISGGKIFINGEQDSLSYLFAFDVDGNLLWKSQNGLEFMGEGFSSTYPGARSTPTVVNNLVYTSSGHGRIACYETSNGTEKWAIDLYKDFSADVPFFGYAESLLVDENNVYSFVGGSKTNMAAFDRFTGELVWSSEALKDTFSYCSPIFVELPERKIIVTHSRHQLFAVDSKNGQALGSFPLHGFEWDGRHCNSPLFSDGFIYFIGNDEKGQGALKLKIENNGESIDEVWYNNKIRNNFSGYVKVGDGLFTTVKGNWLKKLNIENGIVEDSIKTATGSLIVADSKFISYGMNGDVNLIQYKNDQLKVVSSFKVKEGDGHHFARPVVDNGQLFIRHGSALMAYQIK